MSKEQIKDTYNGEGHLYELKNHENTRSFQLLQFIHKEVDPKNPGELKTIRDGTTNEEVLKALINRMYYLQGKCPCDENQRAIISLEDALMWLNKRTENRIARNVEGKPQA